MTSQREAIPGGGEMGALIRSFDWAKTPLGPIESWSLALRMMVRMLLANRFPMLLWWGPDYISVYNDAYRPVLGAKHPALGMPVRECWSEIWHQLAPLIDTPYLGGPATWADDLALEINRHGFLEETHFTVAYSPVPDDTVPSGIGGVVATVNEITDQVVAQRRIVALRDLGARIGEAKTADEACAIAADALSGHARDVPFALLYLIEDGKARLAGASGVAVGLDLSPPVVDLSAPGGWPFAEAIRSETAQLATGLATRFADVPRGPWADPPSTAVVQVIPSNMARAPAGLIVTGVSARLGLDAYYRDFLGLVRNQVATSIANARAYEEERKRAEALAELDREKTAFFSNVSHEFRTPLTLMLGPIELALEDQTQPLPDEQRERLELVHRSGLRLQKLVNTLLDFARIEAGRAQPSFVATDLATLTTDLASSFRSTVEHAGLKLIVNCLPLGAQIPVDRLMWEKIVLNLVSNAFKYTFDGEIGVALARCGDRVELVVRDTGIGIAADQRSRIFERFHRVEGARGRSHEGTGIGLALVQELVKLHGGTIEVDSELGQGTTFRVTMPTEQADVSNVIDLQPTTIGAAAFASEIQQWNHRAPVATAALPASARILVADDNADMRAYIARLLSPYWSVETVGDGEHALSAARAAPPDLLLSDVMMPGLDGFSLIRELRADERTRTIPVLLLSARAGEEATVAGFASGADHYLVKPFSAIELRTRVGALLSVSALRQTALSDARAAARLREDMLAMVSHDLRNPLSAIRTAAEVIGRANIEGEHMDRVRDRAALIGRSVVGMDRLIADLLDVGSIETGTLSIDPRPETVADLVEDVLQTFASVAQGKGIDLTVELSGDVPPLGVDRGRIVQALSNLVANALKFTSAPGAVAISVQRDGDRAVFSVADSGLGIAPAEMDHIFDRYWHAKQQGNAGHGLGLSIAKGIVEAHGGTLHARSELGRGSTFWFTIPFSSLAPAVRALA